MATLNGVRRSQYELSEITSTRRLFGRAEPDPQVGGDAVIRLKIGDKLAPPLARRCQLVTATALLVKAVMRVCRHFAPLRRQSTGPLDAVEANNDLRLKRRRGEGFRPSLLRLESPVSTLRRARRWALLLRRPRTPALSFAFRRRRRAEEPDRIVRQLTVYFHNVVSRSRERQLSAIAPGAYLGERRRSSRSEGSANRRSRRSAQRRGNWPGRWASCAISDLSKIGPGARPGRKAIRTRAPKCAIGSGAARRPHRQRQDGA
jgi:hypothetical protein